MLNSYKQGAVKIKRGPNLPEVGQDSVILIGSAVSFFLANRKDVSFAVITFCLM